MVRYPLAFSVCRRSLTFTLLLPLAFFSSQCVPKSRVGSSVKTESVSTSLLWPKTTLTLCYDRDRYDLTGTNLASSLYEAAITQAAQENYSIVNTGVAFSGFAACKDTPNPDVSLILDDKTSGGVSNQVGTFRAPDDPDDPTFGGVKGAAIKIGPHYITKQAQLAEDLTVAEVAIHEMGHILGLFHEHAHPKSTCKIAESAAEVRKQVGDNVYPDRGLPYDPYSIMSYCNINLVIGRITSETPANDPKRDPALDPAKTHRGLSDGDKAMLKNLYTGVYKETDALLTSGSSGGTSGSGGTAGSGGTSTAPNGYPYCSSGTTAGGTPGWSTDQTVTDPNGNHSCVIRGGSADH